MGWEFDPFSFFLPLSLSLTRTSLGLLSLSPSLSSCFLWNGATTGLHDMAVDGNTGKGYLILIKLYCGSRCLGLPLGQSIKSSLLLISAWAIRFSNACFSVIWQFIHYYAMQNPSWECSTFEVHQSMSLSTHTNISRQSVTQWIRGTFGSQMYPIFSNISVDLCIWWWEIFVVSVEFMVDPLSVLPSKRCK